MTQTKRTHSSLDYYLLLVAAFLAPIIGGHVALEPRIIQSGILGEIFGGGSLPYLSRLLVGILILVGLSLMALKNRVIQLPNLKIIICLTLLVVVLGSAIVFGEFGFVAIGEWLTWFIYGASLFLTVSTIGRGKKPAQLAQLLSGGITIVAIRGIFEYTRMMADEPTYRIFAGWNNPNAVASILIAGTLIQLGLLGYAESKAKIIPGIGAASCLAALILTQSKGGYLALAFGVLIFVLILLAGGIQGKLKPIGYAFGAIILGLVIAIGLTTTASSNSQASALGRISASSSSAEQSVGFRRNLWESALAIAQNHPAGTGPGTFRFYSAEPGITDITVFAHQTFLQLATEGGWLALFLFLALAYFWLTFVFRGLKKQPISLVAFRAGAGAATIGLVAHGMVESNLSFLGSGVTLFILVGLSLQLSTDGTSPEAVPRPIRVITLLGACVAPLLGLSIYAASESQKVSLMTALANNQPDLVGSTVTQLKINPYGDPESDYLFAMYGAESNEERLAGLGKAASKMPQPRILRAYARSLAAVERYDEALFVNEKVFKFDPNNLNAHWLKIELLTKKEDIDGAKQAALALLKVEQTIAFQVRAIPEIIPTETYEARLFLAQYEPNKDEKIKLLETALVGFSRYFNVTAPLVKRMTDGGLPDYGGQSREDVETKLAQAKSAFLELEKLYGSSGKEPSSGVSLIEISKSLDFAF